METGSFPFSVQPVVLVFLLEELLELLAIAVDLRVLPSCPHVAIVLRPRRIVPVLHVALLRSFAKSVISHFAILT